MIEKPLPSIGEGVAKTPLRVLHLEDNPHDRVLLQETINGDGLTCQFVQAASQKEFEDALRTQSFDVIISDFTIPSYDGMAALAAARRAQPETPFLFVSGTIGEERAVESLKSGAIDYILKDHLGRLVPAIQRALREAQERVERRELEAQLRHAQKMEAIGQLAGGVAHDFNNMLAVIRGNVELVLMHDEGLTKEARDCLKQITAASERAASLTRQLLAFGSKQVIQAEPINLNDTIGNLAKMLKRIIGGNIQLEHSSSARSRCVQADVGMMEQVLVNLVVNARDAMPNGGRLLITTESVTVTNGHVRMHPEARNGEFVCLTVTDTGTGISPEHLPRIFEPFFTTKESGKGTGLGLPTVHGIVKQHQGWIEIHTRVGEGTSFRIFLPAIATPETTFTLESGDALPRGGDEHILLVEDDEAVRLLTRRILESFGYDVLDAPSGAKALEMASDSKAIDLLVTDIVMPDGVTGRELAEQLKNQRPQLKTIYVSGYNLEVAGKDTDFIEKNKGSFLQKPYASQALLSTVRRCLDESKV